MRRFSSAQRFSVIMPVHVANRLAFMSRQTADRLRRELDQIAELASVGAEDSQALRLAPESAQLYVEADGFRLHYQVDSINRSVIANSVEEMFA